jgi:hypothetical protein
MPNIDDALGRLEELATLTDDQLLEKYKSCFIFEQDFLKHATASASKSTEDDDGENRSETSEGVESATKRILEKKKSRKKVSEEELKKMLLGDAELLKDPL